MTAVITIQSACQKAPQAEIDEAKAMLDSAQVENIQHHYPKDYQMLKDSVNAVLESIEGEKSKITSTKHNQYKEQLKSLSQDIKQLIQKKKDHKKLQEMPELGGDSKYEA